MHIGEHDRFHEEGYLGPRRILSPAVCRRFLDTIAAPDQPAPLDWPKGHAAVSRAYFELATHPAIVEVVTALLGPDVLLWGASMADRGPGVAHPWHSDIESCDPAAKTVTVWIGLEHTSADSSLQVIPYSHRFETTVQEARLRAGRRREETSVDDVVGWARRFDRRSRLVRPPMADGDALFFDGRLWHGSDNRSDRTRRALLLQYATPDTPIRIPDLAQLDWPFRRLDHPRPPCVMIRGEDAAGVNRVVPAPRPARAEIHPRATSRVCRIRTPEMQSGSGGWRPHILFGGCTSEVERLSYHVSTLEHEFCPHSVQRHADEEIKLVLAGEVDMILPDRPGASNAPSVRVHAGEFVCYPGDFGHTIVGRSEQPATYLVLKWFAPAACRPSMLGFEHHRLIEPGEAAAEGFSTRTIMDGPTGCVRKLHCHVSTLTPGAGYAPHIDAHDAVIVVLEGEVQALGERARPFDLIFCAAGEPHGMHNPGPATARYVVFEFHGGTNAFVEDSEEIGVAWPGADRPRRPGGLRRLWSFARRAVST